MYYNFVLNLLQILRTEIIEFSLFLRGHRVRYFSFFYFVYMNVRFLNLTYTQI